MLYYERLKHDGSYPIIGVNTFVDPAGGELPTPELARSTEDEKQSQLRRLRDFHGRSAGQAAAMVSRLKETAVAGGNIFEVLVDAVRVLSLGEISDALFAVGGKYRRSM